MINFNYNRSSSVIIQNDPTLSYYNRSLTKFLNSVQILVTSDSNQIRGIFAEESFVIENATILCGIALAENLNGIQKFSH